MLFIYLKNFVLFADCRINLAFIAGKIEAQEIILLNDCLVITKKMTISNI